MHLTQYIYIFIVAAKRTRFGTMGGMFVNKSATDLGILASTAAIQAMGLKPEKIDSVVFGHVIPGSSPDGSFLARHILLKSAIPLEKLAFAVNRLCGSGFQAIVSGAQNILVGESKIISTGGAENMSQAPFRVRNIRYGTVLGQKYEFEDFIWTGLFDTYCNLSMGLTAEKLGAQYKLKREEVDQFALSNQQRWKADYYITTNDAGYFKDEITPVQVKIKKQDTTISVDEHPRPQSTLETLSKLKPVFQKDGLITAGSESGICDGASAVILASKEAVKAEGLKPLARLVGYSVVGVEPSIMGIGPAPAVKNLLKMTGKTLDDIELVEIVEEFGAQTLACAKELNLDLNKLNVNGDAIAVGHPLAASGRITAHLVHEFRRRKAKKFGIGSACIGGGQGIAVMVEAL
ncbi:LOW QUALITY PROTEIN: 3-ketoacyl-CoA thiolase, mitochondrial-like [Pogonomyrmex barbatus]|uniref:LOW QUALITY PROTEIN: 3-ketoacyl-CoA thiolase, mitochondrial-like n=1 Tax=Pogonomyrmex barbatus TaxID=144034 RepID=A0A8N1S777_9HYME|nr:LOW QUALITY PROTEIN: 3-ketoacyl-CoA thiolase, mitochondrial-like [Pogonomyrmex barbatus]